MAPALASAPSRRIVFDAQMLALGPGGRSIDTSRFERGDVIEPGRYRLDLLLNSQWRGVEEVELRRQPGRESAVFCYDRRLLERAGIDLGKSVRGQDGSSARDPVPEGLVCDPLERYVPGARVKLDIAEQSVYLSVPSYYLSLGSSKTYVDPASWDSGISAALLNYNTNLHVRENHGRSATSGYAGLNAGLNLGRARLRHYGTATWSRRMGSHYQRSSTYVQTDLPAWRSQLLLGENSTSSEFFDAVSFRGVQLSSDDRMLPDSLRYYAPVVRGTASTNARVSVYQRGYLIYETTVAPGAFALDELQTASYGGDLEVRVTEASGEVRSFIVPFATTVQLLRPGTTRYNLTAGRLNDPSLERRPNMLQGVYQRGLGNDITAYAGGAFTGSYMSGLMGAALNTPVGGFSGDVTLARTEVPGDGHLNGSSYRLAYSKNLPNTGTNFSLLAYRYSTGGYLGLRDAAFMQDRVARGDQLESFSRLRNRFDANISQQLGDGGNLFLNGSSQRYWKGGGRAVNFSVGYSDQWRDVSYSISAQRLRSQYEGFSSRERSGDSSTLVSLNLSIPLGGVGRGSPTLNSYLTRDSNSGAQLTSGISGMLGKQGEASYALSASHDRNSRQTSKNASLDYRLPQVELGSSISQGSGYRQLSLKASGGVVAHPGGITAAQTLGETIGLAYAPNARGARAGYSGSRIDRRGYAVIPNLQPYQLNSVDLDPNGMADDVELRTSSRNVAPTAGAVVWLDYPTRVARPLLVDSRMPSGEPLPFAAEVLDAHSGQSVGAVGQGSRLVLRVEQDRGSVRVRWGSEPQQQCLVDYALGPRETTPPVLQLACRPASATDRERTL
ncbi:usher protein [Pseudomonas aeruginosa]|nr:usher protein [Pseudomonas aeruginosa]WCW10726.1 fimbrial biogenesis outer membrane usher protein [Pseudomonas aeruginosa]